MKKKIAVLGATAVSFILPIVAFAQIQTGNGTTCTGVRVGIEDVICRIYSIITVAIPVMIVGAVAYFIWGIVQFITASDAEEKGNARGMMVHGIIGFAVILGLWGLVRILLNTFGVDNSSGPGIIPSF